MSPAALAVAIASLEDDLHTSELMLEEAKTNAERADLLGVRATERLQEAAERLVSSQEALEYLRGLQDAQAAAQQPEVEQ